VGPTRNDLGGLKASRVSAGACAILARGNGFRRVDLPAAGAVRLRVRADATVLATAPVAVTLTAQRPRGLRRIAYRLDDRGMGAGRGAAHALALSPADLSRGRHTLAVTLRPSSGRARTLRMTLRVAACATRFTVRQYRTAAGSGLRLRIDSRTPMSGMTFTLPRAVARGLGLGRPAGRLAIVTPGGRRLLTLAPAHGRSPTVLVAGPSRPGVAIRGAAITVTGLPASTGVAELTVYELPSPLGAPLLTRRIHVRATALVRTAGLQRLTANIAAG
jgi:hypothetical protein